MGVGGVSIWQLVIILVMFLIGVLPWIMALLSKKVKGTKKLVWFILSFLFSWIGYIAYYAIAVRGKDSENVGFVPHVESPDRKGPY